MAKVSVGSAVGEGFSLIRREPGAVAIWALVLFVFLAIRIAAFLPFYGAIVSVIAQSAHAGAGTPPDIRALLPQLQQAQALNLLVGLGQLLVNAVLACAVFRAVLHPEQKGFAYMRLGAAELFLVVFYVAFGIGIAIGAVILAIPLAIIGVLVGHGSAVAGASFAVIAGLAILALVIWLALRMSMFGPMLVEEGEIRLGQAWAMTRGHFGALLAVALLLILLFIAAEIVLAGAGFSVMAASIGGFGPNSPLAHASFPEILARLAPALAVFGLGWLILIGIATPLINAPWARAFRDLRQTDVAAAFN